MNISEDVLTDRAARIEERRMELTTILASTRPPPLKKNGRYCSSRNAEPLMDPRPGNQAGEYKLSDVFMLEPLEWKRAVDPRLPRNNPYQVNQHGDIRTDDTLRLQPSLDGKYVKIKLDTFGTFTIHRLVCNAFNGEITDRTLDVDHIDRNSIYNYKRRAVRKPAVLRMVRHSTVRNTNESCAMMCWPSTPVSTATVR
jgi:hypothetical protein